ncbi:MAG: 50S ribosomal protein L24e [Candidatus Woesearchaeota archaeon]
MVKCSFSGKEIPEGTGIMYVKKDGKILYFYDKKCEKNMLKLNRKPRTTKWTKEYVKGEV